MDNSRNKKENEEYFWGDYNPEHKAINIYTREDYIRKFGVQPEESQKVLE
ncbi:MAG: hypothetical protein J5527_09830 [Treponema sp.]|nr:hypothetical protein [Treponema sp.]